MNNELLWIHEGGILDDAGNLISTSYVDLREERSRSPIQTLVKGCRREHALEDAETILVSPLERFRKEGANLIRDEHEGLAKEESETVEPETPEQAVERRQVDNLNEAVELLDSGIRLKRSVSYRSVQRSQRSIAFGRECWIFSTTITPETKQEWEAWRATLDPCYDHESVIGQPAKFAQAMGRMVTEQFGPQGKDGWLKSSIGDAESVPYQTRVPNGFFTDRSCMPTGCMTRSSKTQTHQRKSRHGFLQRV